MSLAATLFLVFGFGKANGQGLLDEAGALKGLSGLYIMGGDVGDELIASGLEKEAVLAQVSSRLKSDGIQILDEMEWLMLESAPVLFIDIRADNEVYIVRMEILHLVHPLSTPSSTSYAVIWGESRAGLMEDEVEETIFRDLELLSAILANDFNTNQ